MILEFDNGYIEIDIDKRSLKAVDTERNITVEIRNFRKISLFVWEKQIVDTYVYVVFTYEPKVFYSSENLLHLWEIDDEDKFRLFIDRMIEEEKFLRETKRRMVGVKTYKTLR